MSIADFRDLSVWQLAMDLAESVYHLTLRYPKSEIYGLSSQLQRAAVSIPSNIAEGHARDSTKEFLRFLSVAQGSLAELETQLILSGRLNYLDQNQLTPLLEKSREVGRMPHGLQHALRARDTG
ncbi:MAG TPA: four helix bundle protein [Burkholderiales bacterium]|nr:four helix bundle protein [Burkholderiales bacterium]